MKELMTLEEVADYLRVTKKTIYRLLEGGKIPATKVGRQWRFNKATIEEWLGQRSAGSKANILVVDDEKVIRALLRDSIEDLGHRVVSAETSAEGLKLAKEQDFNLVFLDLKMPGMNGAELFRQIRKNKPKVPVVIITGYPESELMARAMAYGPFGVMNKPFSESDIITAVSNFLRITR